MEKNRSLCKIIRCYVFCFAITAAVHSALQGAASPTIRIRSGSMLFSAAGGSAALPLAMGVLPAVFAGADPHHALERTAERLDAVVPQPLRQIRNLAAILQQNTGRLDAELLQILGKVGAGLLLKMADRYPSDRLNSALTMARPRFGLW